MSGTALTFVLVLMLFVGMLALIELGRRLGARRMVDEAEREQGGLITVDTAIYALLGLLVAFTFSGAASRFEDRRVSTVQEANAIGTAYLRLDLLPAAAQPALREQFRRYAEARLATYQALPDVAASDAHAARAVALQMDIWRAAVAALRDAPPNASLLVLPALNEMIDVTSIRGVALKTDTPTVVLGALVFLALLCALLVGYGMAGTTTFSMRLHMVGFALAMTATIYVIVDLDHPRAGLIRLDFADQAMIDVLSGMK